MRRTAATAAILAATALASLTPASASPAEATGASDPALDPDQRAGAYETAFVEVGVGPWNGMGDSPFTDRLTAFSYEPLATNPSYKPMAQTSVTLHRHLAVVGTVSKLDSQRWTRSDRLTVRGVVYRFDAWRFGAGVRAKLPVLSEWVVPYVQATAGPTYVTEQFAAMNNPDEPPRWGVHAAAGAGLQLVPRFGDDTRLFGLFAQVEAIGSTGLSNLLGDRHPLGGLHPTLGLRGGM